MIATPRRTKAAVAVLAALAVVAFVVWSLRGNDGNRRRVDALKADAILRVHPPGARRTLFTTRLGGEAMGQTVGNSVDAWYSVEQPVAEVAAFYVKAAESSAWLLTPTAVTCLTDGNVVLHASKNHGRMIAGLTVTVEPGKVYVVLSAPATGTGSDAPAKGSRSLALSQTCLG